MKRRQIKTSSFNPPIAEAKRISVEINKIVKSMAIDYISMPLTNDRLEQLFGKYKNVFDSKSQDWGRRVTNSAYKASTHQVDRSLKELSEKYTIGNLKLGFKEKEIFKASVQENANLFKTIPEQFHKKVAVVVFNAITHGEGAKDIASYIKKFDNGTRNYVQLRTMDQTRKAFSALSRQRMIDAGINKFQWVHTSGSEEPRKLHQELNGKVFDIDNPPYIGDMYGNRIYGFPSQLPNCKCKQKFVFADLG